MPVCESPLSRVSVCACTNGRGGRVQVGGEYNREERKRCDVTIMIAFNSSTLPLLYCWRHIWFTVLPVQSSMPQTVPTDGTRTYYSVRTIVLPCCRQKSKGSQIDLYLCVPIYGTSVYRYYILRSKILARFEFNKKSKMRSNRNGNLIIFGNEH